MKNTLVTLFEEYINESRFEGGNVYINCSWDKYTRNIYCNYLDKHDEVLSMDLDENFTEKFIEIIQKTYSNNEYDEIVVYKVNDEYGIAEYKEYYKYLFDNERAELFNNKYFNKDISLHVKIFMKNPNKKDTNRDKQYISLHEKTLFRKYIEEYKGLDIEDIWKIFISEFDIEGDLESPINSDQRILLEKSVKEKIPNDFFKVYKNNNGEIYDKEKGVFYGLTFMNIEEIIEEMVWAKEFIKDEGEDGIRALSRFSISYPKNYIKEVYWNSSRLPIAKDFCGNFIGIDLEPDVEGEFGQIINFGRDEDEKIIISNSLSEFLILLIYLEREGLKIDNEEHFIDYLKDIMLSENK